jgi:hypothetical protein
MGEWRYSSFILNLGTLDGGARIAQSVWRLAMGWTTKWSEFESWWEQEFSLLPVIQVGSGAHPASYQMDSGVSFPGSKAAGV